MSGDKVNEAIAYVRGPLRLNHDGRALLVDAARLLADEVERLRAERAALPDRITGLAVAYGGETAGRGDWFGAVVEWIRES